MADATTAPVATATPAPAPAAPAAEAPAVDIVEQAFDRIAAEVEAEEARSPQTETAEQAEGEEPAEAAEAEPEKPEPAEQTAEQLEAADEALFADAALKTADGVKKAAARLRELHAKTKMDSAALTKRQREVDRDWRRLRVNQSKFEKTRDDHVAWHRSERDTARLLGQHVNVLRTGTPAQVIESLGYLTGKDGLGFYEEIVKNAAGLRQAPNPEIEALRAELRGGFAELERQRAEMQTSAQIEQRRAQVAELEAKVIETAKDATKYPALAHFTAARPKEVIAEIKRLRKEYRNETGEALPMAEAMLQLNQTLAPYLTVGGGGAGNPRPDEGQNPGGQSNRSSSTRNAGGVAGIPPSASARVAPVRPITEEERRQELTPEFFADIGLW